MTATNFMAIFSKPKKMLRREIVFQFRMYGQLFMEWWRHDEEFLDPSFNWYDPATEDFVLVPMAANRAGAEACLAAIDKAIFAKTGVHPILPGNPFGNCALIHPLTGLVDKIIRADDEIDCVPGRFLKNDPFADIGDTWDFNKQIFRKAVRGFALFASTAHFEIAA